MILTRQTGQMSRHKCRRDMLGMKAMLRGRGLNDPNIMRLPAKLQGMLKGALENESRVLSKPVNNLVWRVDRNGCIHIYDKGIKVQ